MKKKKPVIAWAGFLDGRIGKTIEDDTYSLILAIYPTKVVAKQNYEDVRKVEIKEVRRNKS